MLKGIFRGAGYGFGAILLLMVQCAFATGPSSAEIEIVPLAVNAQGIVLCKTVSHINLTGAQTLSGKEYGWLVVSADGVWQEEISERLDEATAEDLNRLDRLERAYAQRTSLREPPPSLSQLMRKYGFTVADTLLTDTAPSCVSWNNGQLCVASHCSAKRVAQRTLKGITSQAQPGRTVVAHFYQAGIALFANQENLMEEEQQGADFFIENKFEGEDIGVDIQNIMGIAIIPDMLRE